MVTTTTATQQQRRRNKAVWLPLPFCCSYTYSTSYCYTTTTNVTTSTSITACHPSRRPPALTITTVTDLLAQAYCA